MFKLIGERLKESAQSILPFFSIILIIHFSGLYMIGNTANSNNELMYGMVFDGSIYANYSQVVFNPTFLTFLIALPLMIIGSSLFGIGADQAMEKMGTMVGSNLTKRKSIFMLVFVSFLLGTLCTFAEPDLTVFSKQLLGGGQEYVLITIISIGVGLLMGLAFMRVIFQWNFKIVLYFLFIIVFALCILIDRQSFFPIIFDGSGVTVGSITVPFVLAMSIAVAQMRGGNAEDDSFGISGLGSIGPLITVAIWAKFQTNISDEWFKNIIPDSTVLANDYSNFGSYYGGVILDSIKDVSLSLAPLTIFFFIYELIFLHLKKNDVIKIVIGLVETFFGLSIFLIGVNSGLMIVGRQMGESFATNGFQNNFYVVVLMCIVIGLLVILAEPAVKILGKQVEDVSRGSIGLKEIYISLCTGVCLAFVFGILKVQYEWDVIGIYVPVLLITFILTLFSPDFYTALAFDSAGIASSTMTSAFLLPMCIGFAVSKFGGPMQDFTGQYENITRYGTGVLGLVYVFPLMTIELLGVYGKIKQTAIYNINRKRIMEPDDSQIIHLPNEEYDDDLHPRMAGGE